MRLSLNCRGLIMKTSVEKVFRDYLAKNDQKLTPERKEILKEVFRIHGHFNADDITIGLRTRKIRVSRASVYRTLPLLVESGLLRKDFTSEKHSQYEHIYGHEHHDHLVCTCCGKTIEFSNQLIEDLQNKICTEHNFKATHHRLEISGLCIDCQNFINNNNNSKEIYNDTK